MNKLQILGRRLAHAGCVAGTAVLVLGAFTGCGQKGPLYLVPTEVPAPTAEPVNNAPTPPADNRPTPAR